MEPHSSLLREFIDVVPTYEFIKSSYSDMPADVNVLVVNDNGKVMHDVENENDVEIENALVNKYHNYCESGFTDDRSTLRWAGERVACLRGDPSEIGFAYESDEASKAHSCNYDPSYIMTAVVIPTPLVHVH